MSDTIEYVHFRVDTPALLLEIVNCAMDRKNGVLKIPINIFRDYLCRVAERAIEIDDPKLNILMLEMNLYEVAVQEIPIAIEQQKSRIK
jgi:hypothetical protein